MIINRTNNRNIIDQIEMIREGSHENLAYVYEFKKSSKFKKQLELMLVDAQSLMKAEKALSHYNSLIGDIKAYEKIDVSNQFTISRLLRDLIDVTDFLGRLSRKDEFAVFRRVHQIAELDQKELLVAQENYQILKGLIRDFNDNLDITLYNSIDEQARLLKFNERLLPHLATAKDGYINEPIPEDYVISYDDYLKVENLFFRYPDYTIPARDFIL